MTPTSPEEAVERLGIFVRSSLKAPDLADDDDIFEKGDASSLFAMELVMFIEQELGVLITDEDLERENFSSIRSMSDILHSKLGHDLG